MYAHSADPWQLGERAYDRRKYAFTPASLSQERYRSAFEPACSVGVLTAAPAPRCDRLLACDLVSVAVEQFCWTSSSARTAPPPRCRPRLARDCVERPPDGSTGARGGRGRTGARRGG
ncbi:hypothetical protein GTZ85_40270 [Streptomyces sp. SID5474]|nr:hypothetical protein [Streptomyces sp. SID5474]